MINIINFLHRLKTLDNGVHNFARVILDCKLPWLVSFTTSHGVRTERGTGWERVKSGAFMILSIFLSRILFKSIYKCLVLRPSREFIFENGHRHTSISIAGVSDRQLSLVPFAVDKSCWFHTELQNVFVKFFIVIFLMIIGGIFDFSYQRYHLTKFIQ